MTLPTEPVPGAAPAPEPKPQPDGVTQARQEFARQAPVGPMGSADRTAAMFGMPKATPDSAPAAGPQPILSTEPFRDPSVDPDAPTQPYSAAELGQMAAQTQPAEAVRNMAGANMITGMGEDLTNPTNPMGMAYVPTPEQNMQAAAETPTPEQPAPKKPWWKIW